MILSYASNLSLFFSGTGNETEIYIVDSGVRRTHLEFGGRAYYLNTFNDPLVILKKHVMLFFLGGGGVISTKSYVEEDSANSISHLLKKIICIFFFGNEQTKLSGCRGSNLSIYMPSTL